MIPVAVKDANGVWHELEMMLDSGNDTTIIKKADANRLGFRDTGMYVQVVGISGVPQRYFVKDDVEIRIGDTEPLPITAVIGDTDINLLGRRDVFQNFEVTFTPQGEIKLVQRSSCSFCI